jgi:hypothetical protein
LSTIAPNSRRIPEFGYPDKECNRFQESVYWAIAQSFTYRLFPNNQLSPYSLSPKLSRYFGMITFLSFVCVFITAVPIRKLFAWVFCFEKQIHFYGIFKFFDSEGRPGQQMCRFSFNTPDSVCVCVYYCSAYYKLLAWGEGDSGGHVLRETTSRGLSGLVCPSRTGECTRGRRILCERRGRKRGAREGACTGAATMPQPSTS